ncbi:hypothetical protein CYMTET_52468, partial [Cymbomonas tetramitiformis]
GYAVLQCGAVPLRSGQGGHPGAGKDGHAGVLDPDGAAECVRLGRRLHGRLRGEGEEPVCADALPRGAGDRAGHLGVLRVCHVGFRPSVHFPRRGLHLHQRHAHVLPFCAGPL